MLLSCFGIDIQGKCDLRRKNLQTEPESLLGDIQIKATYNQKQFLDEFSALYCVIF